MRLKLRHLKPSFFARVALSLWLSRKVTSTRTLLPIRVSDFFHRVHISVAPSAKFVCNGILRIERWQSGNEPVSIILGENSKLIIDGDFIIGNGTRIFVDKGASLYIGGRRSESASGITERSLIMVRKKVSIGVDCIIAWNVFITDCDWHTIHGKSIQADVEIGDHVWIACNTSILKGSKIGNDCIIGAYSLIQREIIPNNCLAVGNPARIVARDVQWSRDILYQ
jgi:acetyltransferase-like isoleucine patch superfamily enzyme